jgi:hypothetical protein
MRRASILLVVVCVTLLAGCYRPDPTPPWDPYPYSFTDTTKDLYPRSSFGAQRFVSDARALWLYAENNGANYPEDSYRLMRGDCDDFAVMVSYYLQEYFHYDTLIVILEITNVGGHACAFVTRSSGAASSSEACLSAIPTVIRTEETYLPVDFYACPGWIWSPLGQSLVTWEWYQLAGNPTLDAD